MLNPHGFSSLFIVLAIILIASALLSGWLSVLGYLIVFSTILFYVYSKFQEKRRRKKIIPDWFYSYNKIKRRWKNG